MAKDFILAFISKLKICRLSPGPGWTAALRASTLLTGFISAESAVIGRFWGANGFAISMMTTLLVAPVSRTQMYLSDSMVTLVKVMNCWPMPTLGSCKEQTRWNAESPSFVQVLKAGQKLANTRCATASEIQNMQTSRADGSRPGIANQHIAAGEGHLQSLFQSNRCWGCHDVHWGVAATSAFLEPC